MNRWKAILAAFLIFATGVGTGVLGHKAVSNAARRAPRDFRFPPPGGDNRPDFMGRLQRDLALSEDQAKRIDSILQEGRKRNRQIWETIQPQLREEMRAVRERIHAELNPMQRSRYDEIMTRSRDRRGPRPEGSAGGGPGPKPEGGWRHGERGGPAGASSGSPSNSVIQPSSPSGQGSSPGNGPSPR